MQEAFDRFVDRGHALTSETTSIVVGVNFLCASSMMTSAFEGAKENAVGVGGGNPPTPTGSDPAQRGGGEVMDGYVLVKLLLGVAWWAVLAATLDWDVAQLHAAYREAVSNVVTSKELSAVLKERGLPTADAVLFYTRLTQAFAAGRLPSYRVFGAAITRGLLLRFLYLLVAGTVAMLQVNGYKFST